MVFTDGPVAPGDGLVFGGPYQGFSPPSQPGETDKNLLVENHIRVFKEQVGRLSHHGYNGYSTECARGWVRHYKDFLNEF